jgi:hypothetical protein
MSLLLILVLLFGFVFGGLGFGSSSSSSGGGFAPPVKCSKRMPAGTPPPAQEQRCGPPPANP